MVQLVKDPVLWCRFDPWPGNFHMPQAWPKKQKERKKKSEFPLWLSG